MPAGYHHQPFANRSPIRCSNRVAFYGRGLFKGIAWPDLEFSKALDLLEQNFFHSLTQPVAPVSPFELHR